MNEPAADRIERRLHRRRAQARATLLFERLWPAVWPPLGAAGAFACLALLGIPPLLPPIAHLVLLAVTALVAAGLLWRGLHGLRRPGGPDADRRLEAASGLRHRPLSVLADAPAHGPGRADPLAESLWQAHVA
jgi:membrane protein implicated in regulation of membrane protease activity